MNIVHRPEQAFAQLVQWRDAGLRSGLVPTMGALHEGHLSLVRRSRAECDRTVVTIFVNPTQFGPREDFHKYPRTPEDDYQALRELEVDLVFAPSLEQLYPDGFSTFVEPPAAARRLEGEFRPGHFRGVATIVLKLFQILPASVAYFGQKDYQQLTVIRRMVDDLNVPIRVEGCPTVREPDGLALSSRNRYLTSDQRPRARCLWLALQAVKQALENGQRQVQTLETLMRDTLMDNGADRIDYARIVDANSLADLKQVDQAVVALIAVHIGTTRLIDNCFLQV
ncbi:MAG: pantoate--beta-alanine ligase [Pirellulaceae bacterium]|nr:pantoate--beta-alanine ligase [Pirellulaceae bacterium]